MRQFTKILLIKPYFLATVLVYFFLNLKGVTFATVAEKEIIDAICENRALIKVSINLRLPEGRHKIENAMIRNGEISPFSFFRLYFVII